MDASGMLTRRRTLVDPNWFSRVGSPREQSDMNAPEHFLLLGIDGGGGRCRARLCTISGAVLSEGTAGSANVRLGAEQSFASVHEAAVQCMSGAGLSSRDFDRVVACLALAGTSEPSQLEAARAREHPYRKTVFVTDAEAACIGAHGGRNGGVIVIGTGSIGWAELNGRQYRIGGWGGQFRVKEAARGSAVRHFAGRFGPTMAVLRGRRYCVRCLQHFDRIRTQWWLG